MTELIDDWKRRKAKKKKGNHSGFTGDNNFDMTVLTKVRVSEWACMCLCEFHVCACVCECLFDVI